jgi:hypothetical protein
MHIRTLQLHRQPTFNPTDNRIATPSGNEFHQRTWPEIYRFYRLQRRRRLLAGSFTLLLQTPCIAVTHWYRKNLRILSMLLVRPAIPRASFGAAPWN